MLALAPTGRVPLLIDDGFAVWDSLAIAEYPGRALSRQAALAGASRRPRARARSLCAEMHSGFGELRSTFGMNIEATLPGDRRAHAAREARRGARPEAHRRDVAARRSKPAAGRSCSAPSASPTPTSRRSAPGCAPTACRWAHAAPGTSGRSSPCPPSSSGNARRGPSTTGSPRTSRTGRAPETKERAGARSFRSARRAAQAATCLRRRDMKPTAARPAISSA